MWHVKTGLPTSGCSTNCFTRVSSPADCAADVVVIIDSSNSVERPHFGSQLNFTENIARALGVASGRTRLGVLSFSDEQRVHFYLNNYTKAADVYAAIQTTPYLYGGTDTAKAIQVVREDMFSRENGDRPDVPNFMILLTDGISNVHANRTVPEAVLARASGIHIYPVGIGLVGYTHELDQIATPPSDLNRYVVKSTDELPTIEEKLVGQLCQGMPFSQVFS